MTTTLHRVERSCRYFNSKVNLTQTSSSRYDEHESSILEMGLSENLQ